MEVILASKNPVGSTTVCLMMLYHDDHESIYSAVSSIDFVNISILYKGSTDFR